MLVKENQSQIFSPFIKPVVNGDFAGTAEDCRKNFQGFVVNADDLESLWVKEMVARGWSANAGRTVLFSPVPSQTAGENLIIDFVDAKDPNAKVTLYRDRLEGAQGPNTSEDFYLKIEECDGEIKYYKASFAHYTGLVTSNEMQFYLHTNPMVVTMTTSGNPYPTIFKSDQDHLLMLMQSGSKTDLISHSYTFDPKIAAALSDGFGQIAWIDAGTASKLLEENPNLLPVFVDLLHFQQAHPGIIYPIFDPVYAKNLQNKIDHTKEDAAHVEYTQKDVDTLRNTYGVQFSAAIQKTIQGKDTQYFARDVWRNGAQIGEIKTSLSAEQAEAALQRLLREELVSFADLQQAMKQEFNVMLISEKPDSLQQKISVHFSNFPDKVYPMFTLKSTGTIMGKEELKHLFRRALANEIKIERDVLTLFDQHQIRYEEYTGTLTIPNADRTINLWGNATDGYHVKTTLTAIPNKPNHIRRTWTNTKTGQMEYQEIDLSAPAPKP